jgi:hypothetical protein
VSIEAKFDRGSIQTVIAQRQRTLYPCFAEEAPPLARLAERIPIEFVIGNDGQVKKLWVDHPRFAEGALQSACMKELQRWPFRRTRDSRPRLDCRSPSAGEPADARATGRPRGATSADSFREEVLPPPARTFKASWTGLARVLTRVRDEGLVGKLGISELRRLLHAGAPHPQGHRAQADPLLELPRSARAAAGSPSAAEAPPAPAFELVEVLAERRSAARSTPRSTGASATRSGTQDRPVAAVRRELKRALPATRARAGPAQVRLGQLARTARRLAEDLRVCRGVPASVRTQADDLAAAVESLAVEAAS